MIRKTTYQVLAFLIVSVFPCLVHAGGGGESDARAVGMARANTAIAENTEAYLWNPANLGLSSRNSNQMTLQIFAAGFRVGNNVLSIPNYNKYNGKALTGKDKKDFLNLFGSDDALRANGDAEVRLLGFQYRNYSLNVKLDGNGYSQIPKSVFDLALSDYDVGHKALKGSGNGGGEAYLNASISAGYPVKSFFPGVIKDMAAGMTLKYVRGFGQVTIDEMYGVIEKSDSIITRGNYSTRESHGGSGFGIDLGTVARINRHWTVGASVMNVFSQVSWSKQDSVRKGSFSIRSGDVFSIDFRDDKKDTVASQYNADKTDTTYHIGSYNKKLPMILRVGAAYQYSKKLLLACDIEHFLNKVSGNATPRIAAGAEYRANKVISLRGGMSLGGDNRGFNIAGGAGFLWGKTMIDIATNNLEGIIVLKRFSFAMNIKTILR